MSIVSSVVLAIEEETFHALPKETKQAVFNVFSEKIHLGDAYYFQSKFVKWYPEDFPAVAKIVEFMDGANTDNFAFVRLTDDHEEQRGWPTEFGISVVKSIEIDR